MTADTGREGHAPEHGGGGRLTQPFSDVTPSIDPLLLSWGSDSRCMRILASILVLLLSLSGCTAEVGGGTEPTPTPVDTTEPTPVAPDPELPAPESGWVDDGPTMPGNWQCLTCQGEGRQVYACGPMATTEGLEALGVCTGGVGPALGQDFAGCEGVWLDELGACMVPEATGVRSALVMCGVDSDDVAMVCEG